MTFSVISGLLIPFVGTTLGAAVVFFMKRRLSADVSGLLAGFAAGVMAAASVWSLIIPAIEQSASRGRWAFLPAFIGFWLGVGFLLTLDHVIPLLTTDNDCSKSPKARTSMMALAVTLHNIPEGMAVGVVYAALLSSAAEVSAGGAFALALGIAIQNFPEGAIISMPLHAQGQTKPRAFVSGTLSGAVEPLFGALTVLCAGLIIPAMPYLLSFSAGAMMFVVTQELIPEMSRGKHPQIGVILFAAGFTVMMAMDVALG